MVRLSTPTSYFHYAHGFATQLLAHMLDSLVRVSRRDDWKHSVNIYQPTGKQVCTHQTNQHSKLF